jgi:Domain of Unknown Function (DUF349)
MGFLGLGRPRWKHKDAEIRLHAVSELPASSQGTFAELVRTDVDPRVRAAAAARITEIPTLVSLQQLTDPAVKRIATERLAGVADQWLRTKSLAECRDFLGHLSDQKSLAELSVQAKDPAVRAAAFAKFSALPEPSAALLAVIAIQDAQGDVALSAVARIDKRGALKDISRKAKLDHVRQAALGRIEALEAEAAKPTPEQVRQARRKELPPLLEQALRLAVASDWERAEAAWEPLVAEWAKVCAQLPGDEDAAALQVRFQRARADFIARRQAAAEREAAGIAGREQLLAELGALPTDPGLDAAQRHVFTARWSAQGEIAPAAQSQLHDRFLAELVRLTPAGQAVSEVDCAAAPTISAESEAKLLALAEEAERLIAGGREAKFRFQELHKDWSRYAADLPPRDPRAQRFLDAWMAWKEQGRAKRASREEQTAERLAQMTDCCRQAEALAAAAEAFTGVPDAAAVEPHAAAVKALQVAWKAIGPVRFEQSQALRDRFRAAIDLAYVPINATREAADWERFAHLAQAEELILRVQALAQEPDLAVVIAGVKQAHSAWKQLGPLPRDKGQEAWGRFKAICDAEFERAKPWFAAQDAERVQNLTRKQALLVELQSLTELAPVGLAGSPADIAARKAAHERIKAIQAEWKGIGQVPREHDGELWRTYRAVCDAYFAKFRDQMAARNAEHGENLTRKLGLIVAVEELAAEAESGQRTGNAVLAEVKRLQQTWKSIGHVPKDQADAIWDKWRTACDRVYATLKGHLAELDAQRQENLAKKEALIAEAEELAGHENARWFKDDVRELQLRWREIGHVPRERMDELNERFRAACDRVFASEV